MAIELDRKELLGSGSYGFVFRGTYGDEPVAVKRIQLINVQPVEREKDILSNLRLKHTNIIQLIHIEEDKDFRFFVLELCSASMDHLFLPESDPRKYSGPLPADKDILLQLSDGLAHIHKNNFVHRNIKPSKVLISRGVPVLMKWSGFGLSKKTDDNGMFDMSGIRGDFYWRAPEIMKLYNLSTNQYPKGTIKSDVFSAGLLFFYFLTGGIHPFGDFNYETLAKVLECETPDNLNKLPEKHYAFLIIRNMLAKKTEDRMSMEEVLKVLREAVDNQTKDEEELLRLCSLPELDETECNNLNELINQVLDLNCTNKEGMTPLILLCKYNQNINLLDLVTNLLNSNQGTLNVNHQDRMGRNALQYLCIHYPNGPQLITIIRFLVKKGIDVNSQDITGRNVLHNLCLYGSDENLVHIIRELIGQGIDYEARDRNGISALEQLGKRNSISSETVRKLLLLNANHAYPTQSRSCIIS